MAESPNHTLLIVLIVVILVGASVGGAYVYLHNRVNSSSEATVANGDNVTVNYIGSFGSGAQIGKIFDTSIYTVAINNGAYPKSLQYTPRGVPANYTPLAVHVGPSTPSGGYTIGNLSFSSVVTGFWQGLLGMAGNETRIIRIPADLGYGPLNTSCLVTAPITYTIPVYSTYALTAFDTLYPSVTPTTGGQFVDPQYGWTVLILSANQTSVTIERLAAVGDIAKPQGFPVLVTAVSSTGADAGSITLVNQISPDQAGAIAGTSASTVCGSGSFIVSAVNATSGLYTENFNREVVGETLNFEVTVIDIWPAGFS